ncbi:hypothetical protein LEMLEM_LOCUS16869 [Lemmus lemmus]
MRVAWGTAGGPAPPRPAPPRPVAGGTRQPRPPLSSPCTVAYSQVRKPGSRGWWRAQPADSRDAGRASLPPRVAEVTWGTPARERLSRFPGCFPAAAEWVLRSWPRPLAVAAGAEGRRGVGVAASAPEGGPWGVHRNMAVTGASGSAETMETQIGFTDRIRDGLDGLDGGEACRL